MKSSHISVKNQFLPIQVFDTLCDDLSTHRKWCHDYRMVSDFKSLKENRYWCSYSYPEHDGKMIAAALSSIINDVETFLLKRGYPLHYVSVNVVNNAE